METSLTDIQTKTFFKLQPECDYNIIDSHKVSYKISFEQFKKMMNLLFDAGVDFITVNDKILNKRFIYKIEPIIKKEKPIEDIAADLYYKQDRSKKFKSVTEILEELRSKKEYISINT